MQLPYNKQIFDRMLSHIDCILQTKYRLQDGTLINEKVREGDIIGLEYYCTVSCGECTHPNELILSIRKVDCKLAQWRFLLNQMNYPDIWRSVDDESGDVRIAIMGERFAEIVYMDREGKKS